LWGICRFALLKALDELEFVGMYDQIKSGSLQEAKCYVLKGRGCED